jgi:hypothetical protein
VLRKVLRPGAANPAGLKVVSELPAASS